MHALWNRTNCPLCSSYVYIWLGSLLNVMICVHMSLTGAHYTTHCMHT